MDWFKKVWAHPQKNNQEDWNWAKETAKDLYEIAGFNTGFQILDLACGQGLTTISLSLLGCQIEGRDLSQPMLDFAIEFCKEHKAEVKFSLQDMREIDDLRAYDIVMLRDVIWGIFDKETNRDILRRMQRALRPQGKIILEVYNKPIAIQKQPIEGFLTFDPITGRLSGGTPSQNDAEILTISCEIMSNSEWQDELVKVGFSKVKIVPALPLQKRGLDSSMSLINYVIGSCD